MSRTQATGSRPGSVSRALARDRLGVPAVLFFVLAGVAPLTVAAGVIPTAYATTGLTGIPAAFLVIAVILAIWASGYVAMTRHIKNAGAFYAFISAGLGRVTGVAAALVALLAYSFLQVGLYGAFGPNAAAEASAHLGLHAAWWAWALAAWAVVTVLGLARVDVAGRVLGVLLTAEVIVILAETITGLARPAGGHLSLATLSPSSLTSAGVGTAGVLAVVAVLGFVGFEQAPVLAEEAKNARRTIPVATYAALGMIAVVYAGASWAMAAHAGDSHVVAAAGAQGPGLLFGLGGSGVLSQAAQWLFLTSLFAAALAFHNAVWRYIFALGRENVLPAVLGRTGGNNIPKAASLTQSATGLAVIAGYALAHANPMTGLFFDLGTTGGFGILVLFAVTAVAVIAFFARDPRGENAWRRLVAPALAAAALGVIVVLAVQHYATLLGVPPGRLGAARQLRCRRGGRAGLGAGPQVPPPAGLRHHRARRPRRGPACPLPPGDAAMTPPRQADAGPAVVLADGSCAGVLSQVIADAFFDLAVSRWLIPDPAARRRIFPGYFRLYVEHTLADGLVCTTPAQDAVALWLPAGEVPALPPEGYDERLATVTGPWIDRFRVFDQTLEGRHPAGYAHHHLAILAVRPDRQGHGTGSALLRAHHAALDRDHIPAYLEASDPRTRRLYLAHGYADSGGPLLLPGAVMYPMVRPPRAGQPSGPAIAGRVTASARPGPAPGGTR